MSNQPRAIVSVTNDLYTDQRVHKVCTFLHEKGYDVLLIGRKKRTSTALPERGYKTKRMRLLFETGVLFYAFFNLRLFILLLFKRADVLVSNDLDTLLANYWASKFKRKVELVYDSHEYFTEVPELINRPRVQKVWLKIEQMIFPKLTKIYTVNDSIAKIYADLYFKDIKVVRNISPLWKNTAILDKKSLNIPENKRLLILQGAGINIDRGAEEMIEAMTQIDAVLMVVGDGDVVPQLKKRVEHLQLTEKVIFYGKKPYDKMMNYTYHAEIGLTLDKPTNMNYRLSLPNKVFDYMHAGTAVVATEIKEVVKIVRNYEIGEVLESLTTDQLAATINRILSDKDRLNTYQENCAKAAQVENWNNETKILNSIYRYNHGE
jgi:glycosyltransferase involved in cell wall biosynthesis